MEELNAIPDTQSFVLVATGSYIGEGVDEARLDTLFLAMPIAWKGTLQQYAGRLHRFSEHKKDVRIYDYMVQMIEHFSVILRKQVEISIITRPACDFRADIQRSLEQIFKAAEESGGRLIFRSQIHQKFAIIDDKITWYGSITDS